MARTIDTIKAELTASWMNNPHLQEAYGFSTGEDFNKRFSRVSIESLLLYIVAASIWTLEKLFDTHTAEVTDYIATMKPHTLRWYVDKAKAFMCRPLLPGTDQFDTTGMTDENIAAARIITFAACTESNATLYMKVAKAGPTPLKPEEKAAFEAYLREVKDAGVRIDVTSQEGDHLTMDMTIYYNPLLMNGSGESKNAQTAGMKLVEEAIKNYIENIPFNGEFRKNELEDAIQQVEGVVMVEFDSFEHSETGSNPETVVAYCKPVSGYFKYEPDNTTIIYRAYED